MHTVQCGPRTFEAIAHALAAKVDLVPDFTELIALEDQQALLAAYIEQHLNDESKAAMRSFDADLIRDEQAIVDALPADLQDLWAHLSDRRETMQWVREEIAYMVGIEIGRRLSGGAR